MTICPTMLSTITCYNDTRIFIESVIYGRTDNFTCPPTSPCDSTIDLSWKVTPFCQGKSSCVINGSYDGLEKPCDTNYFNISYSCNDSESEKKIQSRQSFLSISLQFWCFINITISNQSAFHGICFIFIVRNRKTFKTSFTNHPQVDVHVQKLLIETVEAKKFGKKYAWLVFKWLVCF